jgi:cation transporter-like permease
MELLLTVSFVLGIFVLLFSWAVAVVLVKNDAFSDSRTTPKVATTADRVHQDQAPRELADAQVG